MIVIVLSASMIANEFDFDGGFDRTGPYLCTVYVLCKTSNIKHLIIAAARMCTVRRLTRMAYGRARPLLYVAFGAVTVGHNSYFDLFLVLIYIHIYIYAYSIRPARA